MKYVSTLSFGKDSMAMNDLLLKNGFPVDFIIFADTLMEFPLMYEYKNKVCDYFKSRYNKEVIVTKPKTTFESWCFGVMDSGDLKGFIRGIPMVWSEPCYWRRESKVKPQEDFIKNLIKDEEYTLYIGFTKDETKRKMNGGGGNFLYPLIDEFNMTEQNCQEYLINQEMENPLYKFFTRTGCGICPAQSNKAWYQIWKYFPEIWSYMVWIEQRLLTYKSMGMKVKNAYWFTEYRTCEDMEKVFIKSDKQGSLFDFSDEPLKDCFCKI